ncbi:MAG: hypothetical protein IT384_27400 [Deltaproteobacteria bacterium]|nr:hypothetical protein [Deltaproteobacteria bacterium]
MSAKRRNTVGFAVAVGVGLGGGLGVRALAEGLAPADVPVETRQIASQRLDLVRVAGAVEVQTVHGEWRVAREGDVVHRPTGARLAPGAYLSLAVNGSSIQVAGGGVVQINAPPAALRVYLARGRVTVRAEDTVEVVAGSQGRSASGRSFAVLVKDQRTTVGAIGGDAVVKDGEREIRVKAGNEVVLGEGDPKTGPISPELSAAEAAGSKDALERLGANAPLPPEQAPPPEKPAKAPAAEKPAKAPAAEKPAKAPAAEKAAKAPPAVKPEGDKPAKPEKAKPKSEGEDELKLEWD